MNTLIAATAVLAVIIALGQLMISVATLSSKMRTQIINSGLWVFLWLMVLMMFFIGILGFVMFWNEEPHRTIDYMILAVCAANYVGAGAYVLCLLAMKRSAAIEKRLEALEKIHSSEPSEEGSGG